MDMTLAGIAGMYGTVLTPSPAAVQQPPTPALVPVPALQRLKSSEEDAFAYFQSSFTELPWLRRARPGIRRP